MTRVGSFQLFSAINQMINCAMPESHLFLILILKYIESGAGEGERNVGEQVS